MMHPLDSMFVLGWMAVVEVALRLLPLPRMATWMGCPLATLEPASTSVERPRLRPWERRRLLLLDALCRRWPFGDGPCLRQALVAGRILRHHHPALRIGAAFADADVIAHAWLEVGALQLGRSDDFTTLIASPPA